MKLEYVQLLVGISMEVDLSLMSSKNEFVTVNKLKVHLVLLCLS